MRNKDRRLRTTALSHFRLAGLLSLGMVMATAGCAPPTQTADVGPDAAQGDEISAGAPPSLAAPAPRANGTDESALPTGETWQVHYLGDAKVGHGRMKVVRQDDGLVRIESDEELTVDRGGSRVTQRVTLISIEKPHGELVRFESRANFGPVATISRGEVKANGTLHCETETQGKTVANALPWRREWGGFFATDQSLRREPMQPGQTRTLHALQPLLNQVGEVRLTAHDYEDASLLLGSRKLLRIECVMKLSDVSFPVTFWTDAAGVTWKTFTPQLQQTSYRATRELALRESEAAKYDLFDNITIRVQTPLEKGHRSPRVVYRATLKSGDPVEAFVSDLGQAVRRIDAQTAEITVRAVRPDQPPGPQATTEAPTKEDLAPNSLIQSDDPEVIKLAAGVAAEENDPWKVAVALESFVQGAIREKNFSQAFATAAEVAQSREGDCTEHAVLLAALCRARKIPARCAMGLVYLSRPEGAAFAYHMWTEAWIQDRWIPLDGTLGQGGVGGGHLKLAHSHLAGAGPYAAFLPVFRVLGQLELEIVDQNSSGMRLP